MRKHIFILVIAIIAFSGLSTAFAEDQTQPVSSDQTQVAPQDEGVETQAPAEKEDWVKYVTWEGDVDDMLLLRIDNEEVKSDYPVASGYKNAKFTFFAGEPKSECAAKVEVEGRGSVAIRKQYWQRPDNSLVIQIYDKDSGYGHYKFTVYYWEKSFTPAEKGKYLDAVNKALYEWDVYFLNGALAKDDFVDALRWARSAYEIDRLNWDMLNTMGMLYYKLNIKDRAVDVFVILRDYGNLTEDNKKRFKEISPYEYSKMESSQTVESEESAGEEGKDEQKTDDDSDEGK